jgi:hypothetical protein
VLKRRALTKKKAAVTTAALLLDSLTVSASVAYSLRLLRAAYAGKCINVRRDSDNTTTDIGFVAGVLDTASLLTFCGAGNGFVHIWYDQSGNANNLTWPTASATTQPQIVASGVVKNLNGIPTIVNTGTGCYPNNLSLTPTLYTANIVGAKGSSGSDFIGWGGNFGTNNQTLRVDTSNHPHTYFGTSDVASTSTWAVTTVSGITFVRTPSNTVTPYLNNVAGAAMTQTTNSVSIGVLGANSGSGNPAGDQISEGLVWSSALGTTDLATLHSNQAAFYGTP